MKTSKRPWKTGPFVVNDNRPDGILSYVYAPPGWHRKHDGTYGHDGSAGPEHGSDYSKAYGFDLRGARRVVGYLPGAKVERQSWREG